MTILVRKYRDFEARDPVFVPPLRMQGFFKFEITKPDGRKRVAADWFPNLILDQGLENIGTTNSWIIACRVGSSVLAPTIAQTNLDVHVGGSNGQQSNTSSNSGSPDYYSSKTIIYRFNAGTVNGIDLKEVGVGSSTADGNNLFSRALIVDSGQLPIIINLAVDEILDVTYELRCYPPLIDGGGSFTITGLGLRNYTSRASSVTTATSWAPSGSGEVGGVGNGASAYSGVIGAITTIPSGLLGGDNSDPNLAYGSLNFYRDWTSTWNTGTGTGAIKSFNAPCAFGSFQYELDTVINKTILDSLAIVFRHQWARRP